MVLGISNQTTNTIITFIAEQGITFPVLQDLSSVYYQYLLVGGQSPYPRDFIIDPNGTIQFASTEYDPGTMITIIERLLDEAILETEQTRLPSPGSFLLHPAYPNPFNPTTTIRFDLPEANQIYMVVYDIIGREVARLVDEVRPAGYHRIRWNGQDASGRQVASGIYFIRLVTPEYTKSIKMLLLK